MSIKRNGLKVLGLSLVAVLGLMAFLSAGAQANWLVETVELKANEAVAAKAHTTGILTVEKKNLEIQCTTLAGSGLKLLASSATAEGKVNFSGCKTFSPIKSGKEVAKCNPINQPISAGGKALIILHPTEKGKNYILFEPATVGGKFTTIEFSGECALTETSDITGTLVAECGQLKETKLTVEGKEVIDKEFAGEDCNVEAASHLLQTAPEALFTGDVLKFGANVAKLGGIASVELEGANKGKKWAGHV
jgi:hypothetical protein